MSPRLPTQPLPKASYNCTRWLNSWGVPTVVPLGEWWCPILPRYHTHVHCVAAKPLKLPKIPNPTKAESTDLPNLTLAKSSTSTWPLAQADVDHWHGVYIEHLQALFERHKGKRSQRGEAAKLTLTLNLNLILIGWRGRQIGGVVSRFDV